MSVSPSGNCSTVTVSDDGSAVVASCAAVINQTGGGGGVSDGDKGDITVSGSGSTWTIDAGVVGTAKIADSAVTYAKLQPTSAAARLLGRPGGTGSTAGTVSEISVGNGLKFDGASLVVSNTDVVSTSLQIIAGTGLTGGGDLSANRTLSVSFGTSGTTACVGNDSRLTDSRTPTAHKTSHATGGTDPLTPADIGASPVALTYVTVNDETATLTGSRRLISGGAVTLNTLSAGQIQLRRAALTGDVTAAENNNTLTIASNAVTDTKIAAGAVTMAKIAQAGAVSGDVIKWTGTAWAPGSVSGTGTVTSVTAGDGLTGGTITSSGTIAVDFHTSGTSTKVVRSDDARMTDARTPTAHTHAVGDLTAGSASSGQVLTYNGTAWAPATPSGGGTKTYAFFTPLDAQPPASNFATLDTRQDIAVLEFDGAATDEATTFVGIIPEGASLGSGLKVRIHWMADTANTSSNVRWGVQFQRLTDDVDAAAYDTAVEGNSAVPTGTGADGTPAVLELTVTTIDGITAGDAYRLKIYREASDTTNDTMSGDAQLIAVEIRSAA